MSCFEFPANAAFATHEFSVYDTPLDSPIWTYMLFGLGSIVAYKLMDYARRKWLLPWLMHDDDSGDGPILPPENAPAQPQSPPDRPPIGILGEAIERMKQAEADAYEHYLCKLCGVKANTTLPSCSICFRKVCKEHSQYPNDFEASDLEGFNDMLFCDDCYGVREKFIAELYVLQQESYEQRRGVLFRWGIRSEGRRNALCVKAGRA